MTSTPYLSTIRPPFCPVASPTAGLNDSVRGIAADSSDRKGVPRTLPSGPPSADADQQSLTPAPAQFKQSSQTAKRHSPHVHKLELNAALKLEKFGLADWEISTSPLTEEDILIALPGGSVFREMSESSDMSKSDTIRPPVPSNNGSSSTSSSPSARTPTQVTVSTRSRGPVPPSPLSRISSPTAPPHHHHHHQHYPHDSSPVGLKAPSQASTSLLSQNSPCFIHSHLDSTGSLADWLSQKTGHEAANQHHYPSSSHHHHQPSHHHLPPHQLHSTSNHRHPHYPASSSRAVNPALLPVSPRMMTSPTQKDRAPSTNGYESDRSSVSQSGRAGLDGGMLDDDEEEAGSLTRQLAETAQGVREMSKELGRTRVRSRIQHVLIVTKARDNRLIQLTRELALYLMQKKPMASPDSATSTSSSRPSSNADRGMVVYVDAQLRHSRRFDAAGIERDYPNLFAPMARRRSSSTTSVSTMSSSFGDLKKRADKEKEKERNGGGEGQLRYWTGEMCSNSPHLFDFVVTLGGDGTVLFTSWLFQRIVPPVLPFALGSLGFLTNFDFASYQKTMDKVIDDGIRVNLRMRFTCTVFRAIAPEEAFMSGTKGRRRKAIKKPGGGILMSQVNKDGWEALEGPPQEQGKEHDCAEEGKDREIMCFSTRAVEQFEVLNDLVVDRGPSPFVSLLELFGDEHHLTTVQADGLTVSTPTGSTAYSLSAGGSLVHPQIPALLITPICPHTLSFRPMLLPDSMELRICVPYNSRSTAWASFDGRGRVELKQGDHIKVTASKYPFPTVCADKASTDWFSSISRTLRWNEREKQKSFVVVEEDNEPQRAANPKQKKGDFEAAKPKEAPTKGDDDEEDEDEEDEEEDFDIDDKSGGEITPSSPQSPPMNATAQNRPPVNRLQSLLHTHKPGVDSPDRFAAPYDGPPPLSQRHLVEALAAAEISEKDGEQGQHDEIRGDGSALRVDGGGHMIPSGRGSAGTSPTDTDSRGDGVGMADMKTPRPRTAPGKVKERKDKNKCKAFAFFGHDDSASDLSDDQSEQ